jgi:ABC-type oligopeptide transport system ATPase subunit
MSEPLLRIVNLKTHFQTKGVGLFGKKKVIKAVDGVSFHIAPREVLSLVGESGCGKSTVGRTLTHLEKATSGEAQFEGRNFLSMTACRVSSVAQRDPDDFSRPVCLAQPSSQNRTDLG